jgi:hypothetical protein
MKKLFGLEKHCHDIENAMYYVRRLKDKFYYQGNSMWTNKKSGGVINAKKWGHSDAILLLSILRDEGISVTFEKA